MPNYQKMGEIPRKRHSVFRNDEGSLYWEELVGSRGFSGLSSLLCHLRRPTSVLHVKQRQELSWDVDEDSTLRLRHLSALGGADPRSDLELLADFSRRHASFVIDSVELKTQSVEEINRALKLFSNRFPTFFEIPIAGNPRPLLAAIARGGGRVKVRTGGVRPEMFPSAAQLAGFILDCVKAQAPFKATAGLHHALRSLHPLTYEPQSPSGMMHGFLNLLAASAFAYAGADAGNIEAILEENSTESFKFEEGGMIWRGRWLDNNLLREMRKSLFLSFGSCSFQEPICEMKALGVL